ncbi:MAG: NAD(P)/FAD-dependent oxidoreductase [Patescibacteria group bacterium]
MKTGIWDVAVIGGGPAGMMATGRAAELGAKVVLIEKNTTLGKKLLITGGGRCNVTNAEPDTRKLLAKFKRGGKFLPSPFSQWNNANAVNFFNKRGMPTKVEAEQRVFPVSDSARSVWDVLVRYMKDGGVTVVSNSPVTRLEKDSERITRVILKNGREIRAKNFILATGGLSRPETGSTGDGFAILKTLGHKVNDTNAALVPVALKESWVKRAAGVSMTNVKITIYQNEKKQESREGKILFTHVGLSGPAILNMSRDIGELLQYGEVTLELDLLPDMGPEKVNARLQEVLKTDINKKVKNVLGSLVPPALVAVLLELADIKSDTPCHSVTRLERLTLAHLLKHLRVTVKSLLGLDKAIITSGGIALEEIDFKTMRSLKYPNLYIVGDLLDIDRPSGGYSLQLCWTTGFVAGSSAYQG